MHRMSTRLNRLQQRLEPLQEIRVIIYEEGKEPAHEPGTHVIQIRWDGSAEEYIAGESASDASP